MVLTLAPARGQPRPADRIKDFNHAETVAKNVSATLALYTSRPCLDAAAQDAVSAAALDVNALADYRIVRGISGFSRDPSLERIRAIDALIAKLQATVAALKGKPACPPPGTATPPPAQPKPEPLKKPTVLNLPPGSTTLTPQPQPQPKQPPKPPTTSTPPATVDELREKYNLPKCLTDEEVRTWTELFRKEGKLLADIGVLETARDYINSGKPLPDFIRETFDLDPRKPEDLDFQKRFEQSVGHDADRLRANPRLIEEEEAERAKIRAKLNELEHKDCPEGKQTGMLGGGLYFGGELAKNSGTVQSTERSALTDAITNRFNDSRDPVGGGFLIGYRFAPFNNSIVISPFASFDFMNAPVNHTFAGGSFLGTTANFMGTLGVKAGPQFNAFWLYGIAGASLLHQTLNINFGPVASSQDAITPGGTAGFGGAWRPSFLQGFGLPVSVFAEYQHFWWTDANFNRPAASPFFNYTFSRQDDLVKLGFTVDLNPPPPPPAMPAPKYGKARAPLR